MVEYETSHCQRSTVIENSVLVYSLLGSILFFFAESCLAASMPGESNPGILYTVTHLHPAAYLILFLIFVLSVANLVFQGFLSFSGWPLSFVAGLLREIPLVRRTKGAAKRSRRLESPDSIVNRPADEAVSAVRRIGKVQARESRIGIPTPLDGMNHPMPAFGQHPGTATGLPRMVENPDANKPAAQEFKFASAVDIPSPEEVERREKEQLVVSGIVKGPDGKGIDSVIVYLTDLEGTRTGQSCRSMHDTGEFKVLINEPGKYILSGYKRGYIMENADPLVLPIESGKIEGLTLRMIPEGCVVQGRVVLDVGLNLLHDFEVKCVCGEGSCSRSSRTDSTGEFRIPGVLVNSKCHIEVRGSDGSMLVKTEPFETVQRKEIYREIQIRAPKDSEDSKSAETWDKELSEQTPSSGSNLAS
ncbi:MAG: hypothetical protein HY912_11765 [Desulfomonile tiedjei]|uniref:Carboxypeptidase regulatory-like domain-containing protein n=1 Tax=Desulfomonile tiedjei TaxID=2358 RepID=A0A9D6V153_9BACT|nr:hypothetical protein [Desulfomonile tiedjei]